MLNDPRKSDALLHSHQSDSRGGGNHPPPSYAWSGLMIPDMFHNGLEEWLTEAVVLAPEEAILFFGRQSCKEGLSYIGARDVGFCLTGPVDGARRTVQEGLWAIGDAVMEKKTTARGPGFPKGLGKPSSPQLAPVMQMVGCEAWTRECPMGRWEGPATPMLNTLLDVVDDTSDRDHQGFLEVLLETHPLQEVRVLIEEVIKALCTWQWWEHPAVVTDQHMWEKAFWWRSTCPSFRMKKRRLL